MNAPSLSPVRGYLLSNTPAHWTPADSACRPGTIPYFVVIQIADATSDPPSADGILAEWWDTLREYLNEEDAWQGGEPFAAHPDSLALYKAIGV
jgi:hypothetical protein